MLVALRDDLARFEQAFADGGVVQAHQQVAGLDQLAVVLEHLLHDGRDFGAQIGASLGLQRAGDDRPRGLRTGIDGLLPLDWAWMAIELKARRVTGIVAPNLDEGRTIERRLKAALKPPMHRPKRPWAAH